MRTLMTALVLALAASCARAADNWVDDFDAGPFPVGFETVSHPDYSRRYLTTGSVDYGPRPMRIGVWYPAADGASGTRLTPAHFAALAGATESLADSTSPSVVAPVRGAESRSLISVYRAIVDAPRAEGRFPLVLYASSQGGDGYGNALLCELLASHGFIVATVASKGPHARDMPFNDTGAEAQFRDLEFVYGELHDYPRVDHENLSVFGFSFGGLNMIPFALRHRGVRAMVALDGSIPPGYGIVQRYAFLDLGELRSPFLGFLGDKSRATNFTPFLEGSPLVDAYLFETTGLMHLDFSSANLNVATRPRAVLDTYRTMATLMIAFIQQQARGGDVFDRRKEKVPEQMFPTVSVRPGRGEPRVSRDAFIPYANAEGIDAARAVYDETRRDHPDYRLFDYDAFRDVGFALMLQENYDEAVKAFRVLIDAYPDEADSHRRLGEALMMAGQYDEARVILTRGLELDPDSPALEDILRTLTEKEGGH